MKSTVKRNLRVFQVILSFLFFGIRAMQFNGIQKIKKEVTVKRLNMCNNFKDQEEKHCIIRKLKKRCL